MLMLLKCENLSKELNVCNDSTSCLRTENGSLNAKIEELNACNVSVGNLFSNAMNQEQGNTVLKVNICRPSKHYFP
jgi:prefoldin subunit 5